MTNNKHPKTKYLGTFGGGNFQFICVCASEVN